MGVGTILHMCVIRPSQNMMMHVPPPPFQACLQHTNTLSLSCQATAVSWEAHDGWKTTLVGGFVHTPVHTLTVQLPLQAASPHKHKHTPRLPYRGPCRDCHSRQGVTGAGFRRCLQAATRNVPCGWPQSCYMPCAATRKKHWRPSAASADGSEACRSTPWHAADANRQRESPHSCGTCTQATEPFSTVLAL